MSNLTHSLSYCSHLYMVFRTNIIGPWWPGSNRSCFRLCVPNQKLTSTAKLPWLIICNLVSLLRTMTHTVQNCFYLAQVYPLFLFSRLAGLYFFFLSIDASTTFVIQCFLFFSYRYSTPGCFSAAPSDSDPHDTYQRAVRLGKMWKRRSLCDRQRRNSSLQVCISTEEWLLYL